MNFEKVKGAFSKTWGMVVTATAVIGVLLKIKWDLAVNGIHDNPVVALLVIVVLALAIFFLVAYMWSGAEGKENKKSRIPPYLQWKHSILIIDDDDGQTPGKGDFLLRLKSYLEENIDESRRDLVCINNITDYRLAEHFEIIISDLVGTGAGARRAIATLNAIKSAYPYKIVRAISTTPSLGDNLRIDEGAVLSKKSKEIFSKIKKLIEEVYEELDYVDQHWQKVQTQLEAKHVPIAEIEKQKDNYYQFVLRKTSLA